MILSRPRIAGGTSALVLFHAERFYGTIALILVAKQFQLDG